MLISITLSQSFIYITVNSAGNRRPISDYNFSVMYIASGNFVSQTRVSIKYTSSQVQDNYLESICLGNLGT